jgi:hypothetical protein
MARDLRTVSFFMRRTGGRLVGSFAGTGGCVAPRFWRIEQEGCFTLDHGRDSDAVLTIGNQQGLDLRAQFLIAGTGGVEQRFQLGGRKVRRGQKQTVCSIPMIHLSRIQPRLRAFGRRLSGLTRLSS